MTIELGLDDGYAMTKLALPDGRLLVIPSRARSGTASTTALLGRSLQTAEYETQGRSYTVGVSDPESTAFAEYPYSGLNRAIVQHALQTAELAGQGVDIASGLPVSNFYSARGVKRDALIERKRKSLHTPVTGAEHDPVTVNFHTVVPEALAAWYDLVIDDQTGEPRIDERRVTSPLAVVDIGGRTTDFVVVADQAVEHRSSGSLQAGLLDVEREVAAALTERFDLETPSIRLIRAAIETGTVKLYGRDHSVVSLVDRPKASLVECIHDECRRKLGQAAELDEVLFVGGGTAALKPSIRQWFTNHTVAPNPAFANARGLLKFLRHVCERDTNSTVITAEQ